jgi:hypothetical protein
LTDARGTIFKLRKRWRNGCGTVSIFLITIARFSKDAGFSYGNVTKVMVQSPAHHSIEKNAGPSRPNGDFTVSTLVPDESIEQKEVLKKGTFGFRCWKLVRHVK